MKAVGYLREMREPTLEAQQRAVLDCCARGGLEVGPIFTETAAESGAPEFRRMLRLAQGEQRGFTVMVVAGLAVLGDRVRDQARRYLQASAAGLPVRLAGGGDADEALMRAWSERGPGERRRERVREGMRAKALRGEPLGRPPYGYRVAGRRMEVHAEEAAVVREIFRACLDENEGVRRIARRLNDAGLLTRRGGAWSQAAVRDILRNAVYTGTYRRLGIVVPGAHEALITQSRYEQAQRLMARRRIGGGRQTRHQYLLSGLARCGYCGNMLIGARRRRSAPDGPSEYLYYQCQSRASQGRCGYHTRRAEDLERAIREQIAAAVTAAGDASAAPGSAATARGGAGSPRRDSVQPGAGDAGAGDPGARRRTIERELDRMVERRASGQLTAEGLRGITASLAMAYLEAEDEAEALGRRREAARDDADREAALADARRDLAARWDGLEFDQHRALLRHVVAAVVVSDEGVDVQFVA